ncbi:tetraprenyl-beta-curcumene synthase family protein [Alicyclobacillus herbarius]|uniref:tetraprenyl-beta-curcumene synthase family protein n=1 Tax=Alicyclobacillus herbarius TaxID=122960 RepID=UPI0004148457|nr:tetraprenyl-beta-curcumene synthase family protein [Alicyclobacillus herbarius]
MLALSETSPGFLCHLFRRILPQARQEIQRWTQAARAIPDPELRCQALASLTDKRFHADGGCVYAALAPTGPANLVRLIVALQTISDYLDNLCDRCGELDEENFRQLHHAMRDAVQPEAPLRAYYALQTCQNDGGYLAALVHTCQEEVSRLPGYAHAKTHILWLIERYCELQQYKHIAPKLRRQRLIRWFEQYQNRFSDVYWWEFCAAAGSTLGVFSLFAAAQRPLHPSRAEALFQSYFPWVCGLHILLDYWIDLAEDEEHGDFNFVACYPTWSEAYRRLQQFAKKSHESVRQAGGRLHHHIISGLFAMYLSDQKVRATPSIRPLRRFIWRLGPKTWMFYSACQIYRLIR